MKYLKIYKSIFSIMMVAALATTVFFIPGNDRLFAESKIKVFIDAGHGGSDPGTVWYGFQEKTANIDIALRVKAKLEAGGFYVYMTRTGDIARTLDERVALANASGADIFISIHNNASISPAANGTETYWCSNGVSGSSQLANFIQTNVVSAAGRVSRGVKTADFRVIKYTKMPAALVECAFVSNQTECSLLKTPEFREKLASGIYQGIRKFSEGIHKDNGDSSSDNSGGNSAGFTVKVMTPKNGTKVTSNFEIRGSVVDSDGDRPDDLAKLEIYRGTERKESKLIGRIESFNNNVYGKNGKLDGGWYLIADIGKLKEGENILYIYAYDKNGNYNEGNLKVFAVKSGDISVINLNPIAMPGGPYKGIAGSDIKFTGSGSYDPDGVISQYLWDFGDKTTGDTAKPVHKYSAEGTYNVTLTVKDGTGKASAAVSTTVSIKKPGDDSGGTDNEDPDPGGDGTNLLENVSNRTSFVGYITVTADDLVSIFIDRDSSKVKNARKLAPLYIKYAKMFNLRADLAWAQMCHETGFLEYTGDVKPEQNNFAGIGAVGGGIPGNSFASEELGVIAHFAHLAWYYFPKDVNKYCNKTYDPRHFGTGHINYTGKTNLGFLNGRWAPGSYTDKIILFANEIINNIESGGSNDNQGSSSVTANAGSDLQGNIGNKIVFDASSSIIKVQADETVTYMWDWNGDGIFDRIVYTAIVKHRFEEAGAHKVILQIKLSGGAKSTDEIKVLINSYPDADSGGPYSGKAGESVTLDGSKSYDSDGTITKYLWDFGDGKSGSGIKPSHVFEAPGTYTVKLTVTDDKGVSSATVSTVAEITGDGTSNQNQPPVADAGGPYIKKAGSEIILDGSGSKDADGVIKKYTWDFGDGSTGKGMNPAHLYLKAGTYTIKLVVEDDKGSKSEESATTITVKEAGGQAQYPVNSGIITNSTKIIGYYEVTVEQLLSIFIKRNSSKIEKAKSIAPIYIQYGKLFNIRADIAWAQMCHETGFLEYTGDVKPEQNNFVGIGATGGGVPGNSFETKELGIIAHYAHLAWYYYPDHVNKYCSSTYDPRHFGSSHSKYTGDTTVGFLNGRWAPGATYTDKILKFANEIYAQ